MKNIVGVRFININGSLSDTIYYYSSHINLIEGYKYNIENESGYKYTSPVVVILCRPYDTKYSNFISKVKHDIVKADFINVSNGERNEINNLSIDKNVFTDRIIGVWFNKDKRTTVVKWTDGTITKVVCNVKDNFSMDAGLALCYTKRWCFNNNSILFHKEFKKWIVDDKEENK